MGQEKSWLVPGSCVARGAAEGFWLSKSGWLELHLCIGLETMQSQGLLQRLGLGSAAGLESGAVLGSAVAGLGSAVAGLGAAVAGLGSAKGLGCGAGLESVVIGLASATGLGPDIVGLGYARICHN